MRAAALLLCAVLGSNGMRAQSASPAPEFDRMQAASEIAARLHAWDAYRARWNEEWKRRGSPHRNAEANRQIDAVAGPKPAGLDELTDRALRVVHADPGDAAALNAIRLALMTYFPPCDRQTGRCALDSPEMKTRARMAQWLLEYHASRMAVLDAAWELRFEFLEQTMVFEDYWRRLHDASTNRAVRGNAAAQLLNHAVGQLNQRDLPAADRQRWRDRYERYAREIREQYADVPSGPGLEVPRYLKPDVPLAQYVSDRESMLAHSVGVSLPDIAVKTVRGAEDRLERYRGKVLILDFWATWCPVCIEHHPGLIELKQELKGRPFEIIGISVDNRPQDVARYLKQKRALPWVQWHIGPRSPLIAQWSVQGYPTYLIVDAQGRVRERASALTSESKDLIRRLVRETPPAPDRMPAAALREPVPVELIAGTRQLGEKPLPSPDGAMLAVIVTNNAKQKPLSDDAGSIYLATGVPVTKAAREIWVKDLKTGALFQINDRADSNWDPAWSPDGGRLAFFSDAGGVAQLWVWDRATNQARRVLESVVRPWQEDDAPVWLNNDRVLAKFLPEDVTLDQAATANRSRFFKTGAIDEVTVTALSEQDLSLVFAQMRADLAVAELASGNLHRLVKGRRIWNYSVSPDGAMVAYDSAAVANPALLTKDRRQPAQAVVFSLAEQTAKFTRDTQWGDAQFAWSPDSRYLAGIAPAPGSDTTSARLLLDTRNWSAKPLPQSSTALAWAPQGHRLYAIGGSSVATQFESALVYRLPIAPGEKLRQVKFDYAAQGIVRDARKFAARTGGAELIVRSSGGYFGVDFKTSRPALILANSGGRQYSKLTALPGSDTVLFLSEDVGHPPEVWMLKKNAPAAEPLTGFNPQLGRYAMGDSASVGWTDANGRKLTGALLLPPGYEPGKRYPVLLDCYGGRSATEVAGLRQTFGLLGGPNVEWNYQVLASRGYVVFAPESPYGENTLMKDLADTMLPGIDRLVEQGIADPQRLAVAGQSFGGYCVRALVTQTTRFKAAISTAGLSGNPFASFPYLPVQLRLKADPYADKNDWDVYIRNSPILYYGKVETPLLIQIGMNDGVGNTPASYQDYRIWRHLGIDAELLEYHGEGHTLQGYSNQVDFWNRRIEWLGRYLKSDNG